jgi:hypothetical protein
MSKDLLEQQLKAPTEIQPTKDNKWLDKSKTLFSKHSDRPRLPSPWQP